MDEILKKIKLIIDEISDEYPYKVAGIASTYSQYNEAWTDACDRVLSQLTAILSEQKQPLTIGDKIRESNENLAVAMYDYRNQSGCKKCGLANTPCDANCFSGLLDFLNQPYKAD